ncbi:MAG TPA: tRNA pseudouridine(38-40) synthase TruA, partial [Geobacteraceae bacterium]|nr:tRNA pseudouridine(38-40) synthase TruA [Geobacteraceae bacterium]
WQLQPNGLSIQEVMEGALAKLLGAPVRLYSSGRTDAGVHAHGMVAAFTTDRTMPLSAFSDGLNSLLPPDIAVREAAEAEAGFNPRADAVAKHYRYTIFNGARRSPLARLYVWHLRGALDLDAMRRGAARFVGEHDFAAFRTAGCAAKTTVRRIYAIDITRNDDFIVIDVRGSGFLRNMVRIMVGTLVAVGQGKLAPDVVALLLEGTSGIPAGATAPSRGLCLMEVVY